MFHFYCTVMYVDVRLSHPNKDYLLTYLLQHGDCIVTIDYCDVTLSVSSALKTAYLLMLLLLSVYCQVLIFAFLANVNSRSCSLYAIIRPSVCRL